MNHNSIRKWQDAVMAGETTYEKLTELCLERIDKFNPFVNAVSEINRDALEIARALDTELKISGRRSMLHGIPVLIKDNINISEYGMRTTGGSVAFKDLKAPYTATVVTRLINAGAVILGKTNLTEFANFISEKSPNGYSALKGLVINPYGPFDVGGSSSGSGVAVACGFCQLAIGTETSGSIISPSAANGILGLKPSLGLISRHGIMPISSSQDVPGPMGMHMEDLAIAMKVICGEDGVDPSVDKKTVETMGDFQILPKEVLACLRLGYYKNPEEIDVLGDELIKKALRDLSLEGVSVIDVTFDEKDYKIDYDVLYYDFYQDIAKYLVTMGRPNGLEKLEDLVDLFEKKPKKYLPYDMNIFKRTLEKAPLLEADYQRAQDDSRRYGHILLDWMENHKLDFVTYANCDGVDMAARIGLPSISLPIGLTSEGRPIGLTLTGKKGSDNLLLSYGHLLLKTIGKRLKPDDERIILDGRQAKKY